ncbi:MAG: SH3 domain-containing protein [Synergistaceae bacterium]|nr:SH3 domain-containing protein [Synergistaceae bacterium]
MNSRSRGRERERGRQDLDLNLNLKDEARGGGEEYETRGTPLRSDNLNNNIKNDDEIEIPESVLPRRRAFKTCPKCGETVSTEASVCPTCGELLHVPEYAKRDKELDKSHNIINLDIKNLDNDKQGIKQEVKQEIKSESRDDDMEGVVRLEPTAAHKVFVSPRHEEDDIPRRPVNFENTRRTSIDINPDKSYQEFGQYARSRRKRGRGKSLGRKILGFLLLFAAVGGSLWFLLGLRKLPKGETPPNVAPINTRQEREEREERETPNPVEALVQPVGEPAVSVTETANNNISLPAFTPDRNPSRAIITRPGVNLREDHNTVSKSLAKLSANTQAELLERWAGSGTGRTPGPWYKVRTGNREGWVYGDYVQQRGGSLPSGYSSALLKSFGSSKADLNSSFGSPRSQNNTTIDWPGVTATFRNNNLVRLRLNSGSQYEFKNGLRPGLSRDELLNIMGYPSSISQRNYVYSENGKTGISVELRNNNVNSVTVNAVP